MGADFTFNPPPEHAPHRLSSTAWAVIQQALSDVGTDKIKRVDYDLPECKISIYRMGAGSVRCDVRWHDDEHTVREALD